MLRETAAVVTLGLPAADVVGAGERMPFAGAAALASLFVVSGTLVAMLSWRLAADSIERNHLMGLRLPSTMRSAAAWTAGQRAFGPWGIAAGVGTAALGSTLLLRPTEGWGVFIASAASIWLVVLPAIGAFQGDQAAKRA